MGLAVAALLQGCTPQPSAPVQTTRLYAIDLAGAAKLCLVSKVELTPGRATAARMQVGNDGGWCAIPVALDGHPYAAALLTGQPVHGHVYVHPVGDNTRIDYTPDRGYIGGDAFTVTLLPGRPALQVSVNVTR
jgi:hypothetical protein